MAIPSTEKIYTAIVIDFETGGLDSKKHGITQVGAQAIRLDTFEVFASYKSYVIPYPKVEIGVKKVVRKKKELFEQKIPLMEYDWEMTKKYTGITKDICENEGQQLDTVVAELLEFFKNAQLTKGKSTLPIIIGQNIGFDIGFLQQIFEFTKVKLKGVVAGEDSFYGFQPTALDTISLARLMYANDPKVTSYKLGIIAEKLDIDLFDAHDALSDVEATGDIVRVLANKMRSSDGSGDGGVKKIKQRKHWRF